MAAHAGRLHANEGRTVAVVERVTAFLRSRGQRAAPKWSPIQQELIERARVPDPIAPERDMFRSSVTTEPNFQAMKVGVVMETTAQLLAATRDELSESKILLESMATEIAELGNILHPQLLDQVKALRDSRMAVVSEARDSLAAMRDVRKFFLETDYEVEMTRLERFVRVCREIEELKRSGVFDAICDSALHLACGPK